MLLTGFGKFPAASRASRIMIERSCFHDDIAPRDPIFSVIAVRLLGISLRNQRKWLGRSTFDRAVWVKL